VPHHKSAKKRVRQTVTRTQRNRIKTTMAKNAEKSLRGAIESGDKEGAQKLLVKAQSLFARLAKTGVIKPNTAARKTARLTKAVTNA